MKNKLKHYKDKLDYEIDSWDLMDAIQKGKNVVVIDTRSKESYEKEHIVGSINIPHRTIDLISTSSIDKAAIVVTYCDGIGCNASTKGAYKMCQLDFEVKELIGGIEWWKRDGYLTEGTGLSHESSISAGQCGCS